MKRTKKVLAVLTIFTVGAMSGSLLVSCAVANQPHMQAALDHLQIALHELQISTPNKGGHRFAAINLTKQAIDETEAGISYAE